MQCFSLAYMGGEIIVIITVCMYDSALYCSPNSLVIRVHFKHSKTQHMCPMASCRTHTVLYTTSGVCSVLYL